MITTGRLCLRNWRKEDYAPFAAMNADAEVRRYFPDLQTREESDATVDRLSDHYEAHGYTFFAAELLETGELAGMIGLVRKRELAGRYDALEIGWRLARPYWRRGLATEGARACLDYAFTELNEPTVYAITATTNLPSIGVMKKIGMDLRDTFDHPDIEAGSGLRRHVLYGVDWND